MTTKFDKNGNVFFEFSGMPKSGKSTNIDVLRTYFQRRGYDVRVFHDAAADSEIDKDQIGALNIQIASELVRFIVTAEYSKNPRRSIVFLDRGIFDRCVFTQVLRDQGRIGEREATAVKSFILQERLLSLVSKVFLFVADEKDCLDRENRNALSPSDGRIMNANFLTKFKNTALSMASEIIPNHVGLTVVDTSKKNGNINETAKEIAAEIELELQGLGFSGTYIHDFRRSGDYYVYGGLAESIPGPYRVNIEGEIYHRYMDFFYTKKRPWEMDTEESIALCHLRSTNMNSVVDESLNSSIIRSIITSARAAGFDVRGKRVLDFGCGDGLSTKLIGDIGEPSEIVGTDANKKELRSASQTYPGKLFVEPRKLKDQNEFEAFFSIFVMQFAPPAKDLAALRSLCRPGTPFYFNLYNVDSEEISPQMIEAGWSIPQQITSFEPRNNHRIFVSFAE